LIKPAQHRSKVLILVNPKSGGYRQESFRKALAEAIIKYRVNAEVYYCQSAEEVTGRLQSALKEGYQFIIVAGGDGTLAWAADVVRQKAVIGIIPIGTGNAIAQVLGLPFNLEENLKMLFTSRNVREIDGLDVNGRLFLMYTSLGFTASLLKEVNFRQKTILHKLAYVLAGFRRVFKAGVKSEMFDIDIDGRTKRTRAAEVMVINTAPWGLGRYKIEGNRLDDGQLEVYVVHRGQVLDIVNALLDLVIRNRKAALRFMGRGGRIEINCGAPLPVQADGDIVSLPPVAIRVVPRAVRIVVPASKQA
jgi:YegS/Rv2252/BmrU family lipid kinase